MDDEKVSGYVSLIDSAVERDASIARTVRRAAVARVALLAGTFAFVAATSLGIQLSNRREGRYQAEQLRRIEEVQTSTQRTLERLEELTGPAAKSEQMQLIEQIIEAVDCDNREVLQSVIDVLENAGFRVEDTKVLCDSRPAGIGGG